MAPVPDKGMIERIAMVIGLITSLAGAASSWAVNQYRIDALEAENREIREDIKALSSDFHNQGEWVKCLICKAHDLECPGC